MIPVNKAFELVQKHVTPLYHKDYVSVQKAHNLVLIEDVASPINMPPFRQSAMDGYAVFIHDGISYNVIDEVKAGDSHRPSLKTGEAIRIFTGAPVPDTANAVIMQESVSVDGNTIILNKKVAQNDNIRPLGEQVKEGEIALKKGTKLSPAALGYLTSLGITGVNVYKKPAIAIIITGDELIEAGQQLSYGKIYESNSGMLLSTLNSLGFDNVTIHKVTDDYSKTHAKLNNAIVDNDLIIITGGISVGDYDFVGKALQELGVKEVFYKVKQKPGKPLFFGKKENTSIFALPGNPAAALSCFYIYVHPALQKLSGNIDFTLSRIKARSTSDFIKKGDRAQFLKAILNNGSVRILEGQNSSMLQTFALANALVYLPEERYEISIGDQVEVICLPV